MIKKFSFVILIPIILTAVFIASKQKPESLSGSAIIWDEEEDSTNTFPSIMIKDGEKPSQPLGMDALKVDIKVVGNIAVTTLDMTFYNKEDRVLEGELYFPLAEGETVSRFAMEVNGKLREGVVVEKKKGRIAFESTIRKQIDPGLLELTKGNNFKSRVYPIPANGYKRIVIAYEHELTRVDENLVYNLPMHFPEMLKTLDVRAEVFNQSIQPELGPNSLSTIVFEKWKENFISNYHAENVLAQQPVRFAIPKSHHQPKIFIEKGQDGRQYFYALVRPELSTRRNKAPEKVSILWDASSSRGERGVNPVETKLLQDYLNAFKPLKTELIIFSNDVHEKIIYDTKSGKSIALIDKINNTFFDGATQFGCIHTEKLIGDHVLLFSDGLSNFGNQNLGKINVPVYTINTSQKADHSRLRAIAEKTPGSYINLSLQNPPWKSLKTRFEEQSQKFIRCTNDNISDLYPKTIHSLSHGEIAIVGVLKSKNATAKIQFGYSSEFDEASSITIDLDVNKHFSESGLAEKMWAQKKLQSLDLDYESNKEAITKLGKEYGIVTRNTSLIVLDRVEDYVQHKISPPKELLADYNALVNSEKTELESTTKKHLEKVYLDFKSRVDWWEKEFAYSPPKKGIDVNQNDVNQLFTDSLPVLHNLSGATFAVSPNAVQSEDATPTELSFDESDMEEESAGEFEPSEHDGIERNAVDQWSDSPGTPKQINDKKRKGDIALEAWTPDAPYIDTLEATPKNARMAKYIELKKQLKNQPSFYLDVADFFLSHNMKKEGIRALSNIAELELENHALLRILAHRLEQLEEYELAISMYLSVLEIREEEPQSYRDLGLAYALNQQHQKSIDMLYHVVSHSWDNRFPGIEALTACEMNRVINASKTGLDLSGIDPRFIKNLPVDMRVVLNWDTDNCDMDLWVTDPYGEKCFYSHKLTKTGGKMSNDLTRGYGPEEFVIKKAIPGNYKVEVNYFGTSSQTLSGPTTIQVELITNYGRSSQETKAVTRRLGESKEVLNIGSFSFAED